MSHDPTTTDGLRVTKVDAGRFYAYENRDGEYVLSLGGVIFIQIQPGDLTHIRALCDWIEQQQQDAEA